MGVRGIGSRGRGRMAATGVRRAAVVAFATFLTVGLTPLTASASTLNVYGSAGTSGYDVSYPNCTDSVPGNPTFGIVGMTGGRPFSTNGCATTEWQTASKWSVGPSAYFNTGYAGAYAKSITSTCSTEAAIATVYGSLSKHALSQAEEAWAIGCSEVDWAQSVLGGFTTSAPVMWWADIETGNSWSMTTSLNQFTIDGISYEMQHMTSVADLGGIYSTASSWKKITGSTSWTPTPAPIANWVAGVKACPKTTPPFDSSNTVPVPVWLVQTGTPNGVDVDQAC